MNQFTTLIIITCATFGACLGISAATIALVVSYLLTS